MLATHSSKIEMAKRQRSLVLDERLAQLVDALQEGTGATFTRIMSAALLQYFFSSDVGPDSKWMGFVLALERGDISIPAIPLKVAQDELAHWTKAIQDEKDVEVPPELWPFGKTVFSKAYAIYNQKCAELPKLNWDSALSLDPDSQMGSLCRHFRGETKRTQPPG